jgi:hypothetical protein
METLVRQVAISALLMLIPVIVFVPISPVSTATPTTPSSTITSSSTTHPSTTYHDTTRGESTYHETTAAAPAFTFHTWTGHPVVSTTVTVPHTHTRWTDPSPPYSWPPPGYSQPPVGYCDPNDPYNTCWDPQCAPQCGYQAVVTGSGNVVVTSVVTAQPSTVVITQTQPQTTVFIQPPTQTVVVTQTPDYTSIVIAIITVVSVGALLAVGALLMARGRRGGQATFAQSGVIQNTMFCNMCGRKLPAHNSGCPILQDSKNTSDGAVRGQSTD